MTRRLRPADDLLRPDVNATLAALGEVSEVDAAAVKLARLYAAEIDKAAALAAELAGLELEDAEDRLRYVQAEVESSKVLATLGPKLLAVLVELKATPRARSAGKTGGGASSGPSKLQALRDAAS